LLFTNSSIAIAQSQAVTTPTTGDSIFASTIKSDSIAAANAYIDMMTANSFVVADSGKVVKSKPKKIWKPDVTTATWLALVIPGGGQIYNRKYWKLPIVYGGIMGCLYAFNWNDQMYSDYRQAFLDIMDADPNTKSYETFFPSGYDFQRNEDYLKELFKKRKNRYRRWRDLSVFACIGVYLVSIVDAYVDAHLSSFDISEDINLSIQPDVQPSITQGNYYGLNCNISF
jgi:hypothetical protein